MKTKQKRKSRVKQPEPTEAELRKMLLDAGFVFVDKNKRVFGKPDKDLHQGETMIYPEGSRRGIPVK